MKKSLKSLLLAGAAVAIPATVNAMIAYRAGHMEQPLPGEVAYYDWVYGRVAYYRMGQELRWLLVHHPNAGGSSWEWRKVFPTLANQYTGTCHRFAGIRPVGQAGCPLQRADVCRICCMIFCRMSSANRGCHRQASAPLMW